MMKVSSAGDEGSATVPALGPIGQHYHELFPEADLRGIEMNFTMSRAMAAWDLAADASLGAFELSRSRYTVLRSLRFAPDARLPMTEISRQTNVTVTNVTRLVDSLERAGLVARVAHPTDRRSVQVQLTGAGEELVLRVMPVAIANSNALWAAFDDAELAQLKSLLAKFAASASIHRGRLLRPRKGAGAGDSDKV